MPSPCLFPYRLKSRRSHLGNLRSMIGSLQPSSLTHLFAWTWSNIYNTQLNKQSSNDNHMTATHIQTHMTHGSRQEHRVGETQNSNTHSDTHDPRLETRAQGRRDHRTQQHTSRHTNNICLSNICEGVWGGVY